MDSPVEMDAVVTGLRYDDNQYVIDSKKNPRESISNFSMQSSTLGLRIYWGSPTCTISTSTNFSAIGIKFVLVEFVISKFVLVDFKLYILLN